MKKLTNVLLLFFTIISLLIGLTLSASAHSGRTDSSGGHKDNKNKSGLGYYHYHCGGYPAHLHKNGYCPYRDVFPRSVSISVERKTLGIGEKVNISAAVSPSNACNTNVELYCSDSSVIRLSGNQIQAVGYGTAVITAESFNGKTTTVKITVKEITADKVTVSSTTNLDNPIYIGTAFKLTAEIAPTNVDNRSITWSSSNPDVVTVDEKGSATAISQGSAVISATASNGVSGKIAVRVQEKYVDRVIINADKLDLSLNEKHLMSVSVEPRDATYPQISWASNFPEIVDVNEKGVLYAKSVGTAIVTATSTNGRSDSVEVIVKEVIADRIVIRGATSINIEEDTKLEVAFYPQNTSSKDIIWRSSDETVAVVDDNGCVSGIAPGVVTITAVQKDVSADVQIEVVYIPVEKIVITSETSRFVSAQESFSLIADVYPSDATYSKVTWTSSDPTVATVNQAGTVKTLSNGRVRITAQTKDGVKETYVITVNDKSVLGIVLASPLALLWGYGTIHAKKKKNKTH